MNQSIGGCYERTVAHDGRQNNSEKKNSKSFYQKKKK